MPSRAFGSVIEKSKGSPPKYPLPPCPSPPGVFSNCLEGEELRVSIRTNVARFRKLNLNILEEKELQPAPKSGFGTVCVSLAIPLYNSA